MIPNQFTFKTIASDGPYTAIKTIDGYVTNTKFNNGFTTPEWRVKELLENNTWVILEPKIIPTRNLNYEDKPVTQAVREQTKEYADVIDELTKKIDKLKDEQDGLIKDKYHNDYVIENQKHKLEEYAKEIDELTEENKALRILAAKYLTEKQDV